MSYTDFDFPHTHMYESDLRELIANMKRLEEIVKTFVNTEQIKFADPSIWNITSQYAKTTVVLNTEGNAYLSKQAVPSGIQLNDDEYWQEIFNFTEYTRTANRNLTVNVETNTIRATDSYATDDWLIWNDVLYVVTNDIQFDDVFIVYPDTNSNIKHFTVEDFIKAWITYANNLINQYKDDIDASELSFTTNLQTQFDLAVAGVTVDSEVLLARIGVTGNTYTTLGDAIRAQILQAYDGAQGDYKFIIGGFNSSTGAFQASTTRAILALKFKAYPYQVVTNSNNTYQIRLACMDEETYINSNMYLDSSWHNIYGVFTTQPLTYPWGTVIVRRADNAELTDSDIVAIENAIKIYNPREFYQGRGTEGALPSTDLDELLDSGWYGWGSGTTITHAPDNFSGAGTLYVHQFTYATIESQKFISQALEDIDGNRWVRLLRYRYNRATLVVYKDWRLVSGFKAIQAISAFEGKTVAILGDSISTKYNNNAVEVEITADDVGETLSAYITKYDVGAALTIDGYTFTNSDIGVEKTFTPRAEDIGKVVGLPNNYNPSTINPWWYKMLKYANFTPINVSWSGASFSSHDDNDDNYKTSYAWHPAQIRKCGIRTPGTMTRTAPNYIIIFRGLNDFSHSPYDILTPDYYGSLHWTYPDNDMVGSNYGFKEAIAKTIEAIRSAYPTTKIILCTVYMAHRVTATNFPPYNSHAKLTEYNDAIREAADFYGCGLIDFEKSGITFENAITYCRDNPPVHANNDGHELLALKAIADIKGQYI